MTKPSSAELYCPNCDGPKTRYAGLCLTCAYPNPDKFPMHGPEAATYGAIVSFRNAAGQTVVLHRTGPVKAAIRAACKDALRLDPAFLVTAISTPTTIYEDLQGPRRSNGRPDDAWGGNPLTPESMFVPAAMRASKP